MTVLEVIQKSAEFLAKKGVASARLQTELLLAHVLKLPRMQLYLNFERALTETELNAVRELVKRRGQREPLQHVVGTTSFCGLEMIVNQHVLVPRPETELLAEQAWIFLNGQPSADQAGPAMLDFGTGSGCIALAVAAKSARTRIVAIDASAEALTVARDNAERHQLTARIEFQHGDGFAALINNEPFDVIVSNPPYIASAEIETLEPEVRDFDPRGALDGGADGLDFYRRLASEAGPRLKPAGKIMLEFGEGQAEAITAIFTGAGWTVSAVMPDYSQRLRFLIAHRAAAQGL